jgi:membrane protein implicated in regulation of membrane protease activity
MRIAICLTFFGLIGLMVSHVLPFLGYLSMIPAVLAGIIIANLFSSSIRWLMEHIQSAPVHNQDDLIGMLANVSISIPADKTGQIVYVADSVRCQCSAKAADTQAGLAIKNGTKVMIVGMEDRVALVEPIDDPILLEDLNH